MVCCDDDVVLVEIFKVMVVDIRILFNKIMIKVNLWMLVWLV